MGRLWGKYSVRLGLMALAVTMPLAACGADLDLRYGLQTAPTIMAAIPTEPQSSPALATLARTRSLTAPRSPAAAASLIAALSRAASVSLSASPLSRPPVWSAVNRPTAPATAPRTPSPARAPARVPPGPDPWSEPVSRGTGGPARAARSSFTRLGTSVAPAADSLPEQVLLEVRLGQVASGVMLGYRLGDEALLPLGRFLELAEVHHQISAAGVLTAVLQPGNVPVMVDASRDTMTADGRRVVAPPGMKLFADSEIYLGTRALGQLLQLDLSIDWQQLVVAVRDPGALPVAQRIQREAIRSTLRREQQAPAPVPVELAERKPWDGFVLDYQVTGPDFNPADNGSYSLNLGGGLSGGALELDLSDPNTSASGDSRLDFSWFKAWSTRRWLRQLRLGDGLSTGPRARSDRGIALTNAPYVRSALIGNVPFGGHLDPGYSIEAYRGNQLVGFDSAGPGGSYQFNLPVSYGSNPVDFVVYGPYGEVWRFNRTYQVVGQLLPAGRFEYGLSAGDCRSSACQADANLDLRYGLNLRWTVRGGVDRFWRDTLADLTHPYAAITGALSNALAVEGEAVGNAFVRGGVRYEPSIRLRLEADHTSFDTGVASPLLTAPGVRSQTNLQAFLRPLPQSDLFYFDGTASRIETETGRTDQARLGVSMQLGTARLLPYGRVEHQSPDAGVAETSGFVGLDTYLTPPLSAGPLLRPFFFRTTTEADSRLTVRSASFLAARQLTQTIRLEGGVSWFRGGGGAVYTLTLSSVFPQLRSYTRVNAPTTGPTSTSETVTGSVLYDRSAQRLAVSSGPSLQRAGLAGHVFLDQNGNGRLDPGEQLLPGVRLRAGLANGISDSSGLYRIWDLVPFDPTLVTVDSVSLESPLWVPGFVQASVLPVPNRYNILDIPIVPAGYVEGRVVRRSPAGLQGVGGATVILVNRRTGERREIVTFNDGAFYALGIRPGDYDLVVDPKVLEVLNSRAAPIRFNLPAEAEGASRQGLDLVLEPAL